MNPFESSRAAALPEAGHTLTLSRLDAASVGRVLACIYTALAAMFFWPAALFLVVESAAGPGMAQGAPSPFMMAPMFGLAPIIYGLITFVLGVVLAWSYNLAARLFGGIAFTLA